MRELHRQLNYRGFSLIFLKQKKDAAYLNVYIEITTLERLNKFCEEIGGNKSVTTDKTINRYMR